MIQFALGIFLVLGTQQDQIEITAAGPQGWDEHIYHAKDNVVVTYRDMRLAADEVTYDDSAKILTADGRLKFSRNEEQLDASHVSFNVETKAGDFSNVSGKMGPGFFITAEQAHRTEEGQYQLKNATVTTCDGPRPGWTLALARAVVDPNKRIVARGSTFRLENVPLFYMPYITIPSEDRPRQTGFLIPTTSTSTTKGRSLRESFYWAINRSADATFTGEYFTKRGPAGAVDFRAIPDAVVKRTTVRTRASLKRPRNTDELGLESVRCNFYRRISVTAQIDERKMRGQFGIGKRTCLLQIAALRILQTGTNAMMH